MYESCQSGCRHVPLQAFREPPALPMTENLPRIQRFPPKNPHCPLIKNMSDRRPHPQPELTLFQSLNRLLSAERGHTHTLRGKLASSKTKPQ